MKKLTVITMVALALAVVSCFLVYLMINVSTLVSFGVASYIIISVIVIAGIFSITQYDAIQFPQLVFQSQ